MKKVYYLILQPREYEKNSFVANTPPTATAPLAHPTKPANQSDAFISIKFNIFNLRRINLVEKRN